MKVLFTAIFPKWQCHAVAEANFMEEHLAAGDDISFLACDASLKACDANPWRALPHCLACCGLRENLVSLVSAPVKRLPLVDSRHARALRKIRFPDFSSLEELRNFSWQGIAAGKEVISSLITATGSSHPDVVERADHIKRLLRDYLGVYLTALDHLQSCGFEKVYIFNGRFAPSRAWIRACEKKNVAYVTQERFASPDRVIRVDNAAVHNTALYADRIKAFWEKHRNDQEVVAAGCEFFEERPRGRVTGWNSFVADQESGKLPDCWDAGRRNIAIFSSTESEVMGLPEFFQQGPFPLQQEAYASIAREVGRIDRSVFLYLRIHPNSKNEAIRWWEDSVWKTLPNLVVIPPESPVSSYLLMGKSEKCLVWLSSMGAEATYWGKPSIVLGRAPYAGIGAAHHPKNLQQAVELVLDESLPSCPKEAAISHGAFIRRGLAKLPFSEAISSSKLTFKGRQPNASEEVLRCLWNWENIVSKSSVPDFLKRLWQKWKWETLHPRIAR